MAVETTHRVPDTAEHDKSLKGRLRSQGLAPGSRQPFRKIQNERGKYPLKIKHFQQ